MPAARLWRRLAPIEVMRALREDGAAQALARAERLAEAAAAGEAARLETVAAGVALDRGSRSIAAARARDRRIRARAG